MAKTYVDVEQLEKLCAEYAIPYANIYDKLSYLSAEDIVKNMSVNDLRAALEEKDEVFAIQIWQKEDVMASIKGEADDLGISRFEPDDELVAEVIKNAKAGIADCSSNWELLGTYARSTLKARITGGKTE